jgi:hypothetical protein
MERGDESVQAAFGKGKGARAGKQCGEDHLDGLHGLERNLAMATVVKKLCRRSKWTCEQSDKRKELPPTGFGEAKLASNIRNGKRRDFLARVAEQQAT